ncbi:hypothetical protein R6Q59_017149 [Mikania micrantha]
MPSGSKKRKAAKKKKVNDSSTPNPHQGENDGGELSSPTSQDPLVEAVKKEESPSEKISYDANVEEGNIVIEATVATTKGSGSSSSSSSDSSDDESHVVEKKVVVLESAPIESVPATESFPEEISPCVDPVKPVDSLLEEESQVFDEIKNEEKKDIPVEETPVVLEEQTVDVCETPVKDDCLNSSVVVESVLKQNEVENVQLVVEKASSKSTDDVSSSTLPKDLISNTNGADCANETETIEHSDRQAPAASTTVAVQHTTSWKSCCGIFDLFSGSGR